MPITSTQRAKDPSLLDRLFDRMERKLDEPIFSEPKPNGCLAAFLDASPRDLRPGYVSFRTAKAQHAHHK